jgi:ADP-glucose pyrophosphorylase
MHGSAFSGQLDHGFAAIIRAGCPHDKIGIITDARAKASYDFMVSAKLIDPAKLELSKTYTTEFVRDIKVLP